MNKSVDLMAALRHPFDDEARITKIVIGALMVAVPILNFTVIGYELQVIRNVSKGQPRPMPAWEDFGKFFSDGLIFGLARLVYGLPIVLLLAPFFSIFFLPLFLAILAGNNDSRAMDQLVRVVMTGGLLVGLLGFGLAMLYGLVLGIAMPAVSANYIKHGTFGSCFDLRAMAAFIRANVNNYLMVWLTGLLAGLVIGAAYSFVAFIPCIGPLIGLPLVMGGTFCTLMASGHALGQALALEAQAAPAMGA